GKEAAAGGLSFVYCLLVRSAISAAAALVGATGLVGSLPAYAQGKLDARYVVTLAGVPIGDGTLAIDIAEDQFTAAATAGTSGPMRVFAGGQGTSAARGTKSGGQPVAGGFASTIIAGQKSDEVRLLLSAGTVKDYVAD